MRKASGTAPSLQRFVAVVATLTPMLACGAAPSGDPKVGAEVRSADAPNVAQQVSEPRSGDVTAAGPGHTRPTATGAGTSSAPPGDGWITPAPKSSGTDNDAPLINTKGTTNAPERISARHVLIQWMGSDHAASSIVRSREQALALAQEVLRRARNKEDFARLAIEYSDEPGAGGRGGSLGRFGHGQMVPAFDAAAFKLEVGQISDIVESPFGFHIIQRTE